VQGSRGETAGNSLLLAYPEGGPLGYYREGERCHLLDEERRGRDPRWAIPEEARLTIVRTYLRLDERKAVVIYSKLIKAYKREEVSRVVGAYSKSSTEGTKEREELPEMTISW
jgi:hypothetical protein